MSGACPRHLSLLALALALPPFARAGEVQGPSLIWMNLAGDPSADSAIHDFTHTFDDDPRHFMGTPLEGCWNPEAILLASRLPAAVTPDRVRRAVAQRRSRPRSVLLRELRKGDADIKAYDGVIAIVDSPEPAVISFSASGVIRRQAAADRSGQAWVEAFCAVLPGISRRP